MSCKVFHGIPIPDNTTQYLRGDGTFAAPAGGAGAPTDAAYVTLALDATLSNERTLAGESGVVSIGDGGAGGNVTVGLVAGGLPLAKLAATGTPDATTFLRGDGQWAAPGGSGVPSGVICMWGGLIANIPAGWNLCNGLNGTPDLRGLFIKGAAVGADPGATGGAATHDHTYTDVVTHTHTINITDPGHTHVQGVNSATNGGTSGYTPDTSTNTRVNSGYSTSSATTGITATSDAPAGAVAQGTTDTASSEPPYYALAFIQKA